MMQRNIPKVARGVQVVAILALALMPVAIARAQNANGAHGDGRIHSDLAIRQVVAGFSEGWNHHDAAAMCASLAEDVQWTNWRGEVLHTRKDVENQHATLFSDLYKNTHRTDEVKSITYLKPDLASVDNFWTMTGAKARDGSDWPYRAGYVNFLLERRDNRWVIIVSHTADFNAKMPASAAK